MKIIPAVQAYIFDFDGTLGETMQLNFEAWKQAFQEQGITIQPSDYFPLEGMSLKEVAKKIAQTYGLKVNPDEVVARKDALFLTLAPPQVALYPGVRELISLLKAQGKRLAIVTAAHRKRLEQTTPPAFLAHFSVIITGDLSLPGKPDPAPYQAALTALHLSPSQALVVENAPLGIQSARRAGIYCVGIASTLPQSELSEATIVFASLQSFFEHISLL